MRIVSGLGKFGFLSDVWGLPVRQSGAIPQELIVLATAEQAEQCSRCTSSSRIRINF